MRSSSWRPRIVGREWPMRRSPSLGCKLVGLPASLLRFQERVAFGAAIDALDGVKVSKRSLTGIDSLSGGANPTGHSSSIAPGLTYHSVIGEAM